MNTLRRSMLLGLAALTLAGCASKPDLSRIQDPNVDFHSFRTFAFIPGRSSGYPSLVERRLVAATRSELERRGYAFDELAPDMLVNIAAAVEERQDQRRSSGKETDDYRLGRLAIDLFDARQQEIVWHGAAEGRLSKSMLRDTGAAAEKAVAMIFEDFPVKPRTRGAAAGASAPAASAPAASAPRQPAVRPAVGQAA